MQSHVKINGSSIILANQKVYYSAYLMEKIKHTDLEFLLYVNKLKISIACKNKFNRLFMHIYVQNNKKKQSKYLNLSFVQ